MNVRHMCDYINWVAIVIVNISLAVGCRPAGRSLSSTKEKCDATMKMTCVPGGSCSIGGNCGFSEFKRDRPLVCKINPKPTTRDVEANVSPGVGYNLLAVPPSSKVDNFPLFFEIEKDFVDPFAVDVTNFGQNHYNYLLHLDTLIRAIDLVLAEESSAQTEKVYELCSFVGDGIKRTERFKKSDPTYRELLILRNAALLGIANRINLSHEEYESKQIARDPRRSLFEGNLSVYNTAKVPYPSITRRVTELYPSFDRDVYAEIVGEYTDVKIYNDSSGNRLASAVKVEPKDAYGRLVEDFRLNPNRKDFLVVWCAHEEIPVCRNTYKQAIKLRGEQYTKPFAYFNIGRKNLTNILLADVDKSFNLNISAAEYESGVIGRLLTKNGERVQMSPVDVLSQNVQGILQMISDNKAIQGANSFFQNP